MGFSGAIDEEAGDLGCELGCGVQTPTRLTPFVGAGTFARLASQSVPANEDGIDNVDDSVTDEDDERLRLSVTLLGMYPETEAHFWGTPLVRWTGYGRYLITTVGRDSDSWLLGFGVALKSEPTHCSLAILHYETLLNGERRPPSHQSCKTSSR